MFCNLPSFSFQGQQSPECYLCLCFVSMVCLIFWKCFVICHIVQWDSFPQFSVTKSSPAVLRASRMLFVFCALYLWFALYFASCPVVQSSTVFHKIRSSSSQTSSQLPRMQVVQSSSFPQFFTKSSRAVFLFLFVFCLWFFLYFLIFFVNLCHNVQSMDPAVPRVP